MQQKINTKIKEDINKALGLKYGIRIIKNESVRKRLRKELINTMLDLRNFITYNITQGYELPRFIDIYGDKDRS